MFTFKNLGWIEVFDFASYSNLGQVLFNLFNEPFLQKLFVKKVFLDLLPLFFAFIVLAVSMHICFEAPMKLFKLFIHVLYFFFVDALHRFVFSVNFQVLSVYVRGV